jgi:phosphatidate cytidylyltransferase
MSEELDPIDEQSCDASSAPETDNPPPETGPEEAPPSLPKSASQDLAKLVENMNPKWKNWWIRIALSLVMFGLFYIVILFGPSAMLLLIAAIQVKCYHEIISVGHENYKKYKLPLIRTLGWYFLVCTNYFFYGEIIAEYFAEFLQHSQILRFLMQKHRLISFLCFVIGFMSFVLCLRKNFYKVQFALFGWYMLTLIIVLTPSHLIVQNMLTGLIWFFLPVSMVICNDIFAYIFGFLFGKTRLIKLSPKKTWEGFIGGWFSTVVYGHIVCEIMCKYEYFFCPPHLNPVSMSFEMKCPQNNPTFQLAHQFNVAPTIHHMFNSLPQPLHEGLNSILSLLGVHLLNGSSEVWMYPMMWHGMVLASFSSLIAPFGGFLASGFKRAFKIKDFGDVIPGHGGLMDRFDCQYLMAVFVNVYIASVIRAYEPHSLLKQVMFMDREHQVDFYHQLKDMLSADGLIK